jgi:hypothetical protein
LSAKHDWVSANFVYDSIQKGECLDRIDYVHVSNPTPSKKKKNPYTVEDDAKMLWYIEVNIIAIELEFIPPNKSWCMHR